MKLIPLLLIIFWIIIIAAPEILAYLIWWFFIFIWLNMLFIGMAFKKGKSSKESYVKFGNYKIFR